MTTTEHVYKAGERVRFTANALGTIDPAAPGRVCFTEHTVGNGDTGAVLPGRPAMPEGWLRIEPDAFPGEYVPVHPDMIVPL